MGGRRGRHGGPSRAIQLLRQTATLADQDNPGNREQQRPRLGRDEVAPQNVDAAARRVRRGRPAGLALARERLQRDLQILNIGGAALVQNHDVDGQQLHPPILVGLQQLVGNGQVVHVADAEQDDRQIAGYAVGPECGGPAAAPANGFGW